MEYKIYLRFIDNSLSYVGLFKDMIFSWQVDEIFYLLAFALFVGMANLSSLVYTEL